jgi:hypothetical protein
MRTPTTDLVYLLQIDVHPATGQLLAVQVVPAAASQ